MTYTINPNAKNVWIRDNEDTMDLSPITDASSVYLDNGRTLEQELGEGSMVSNIATADTSMNKVIDGTLDGAYESCVLKGRTLVNLAAEKNMASDYSIRFIGRQITGKVIILNAKKSDSCYFNLWSIDEQRYTKHVNVNSNALIYDIPNGQYIYNIYDTAVTSGEGNMLLFSDIMIIEYQEGMENWDIPYFEGICDVKMPILRNVGKNLFKSELELGTINADTGKNMVFNARIRTKDFTLIKAEKTYSIKSHSVYWFNRLFFYDASKTYIGNTVVDGDEKVFTTPKDTKYMKVVFRTKTNTDMSVQDIHGILQGVQIEETSTPTPYEDHKTNVLHTSEEIVLRSLPNGVKDTYNVITGEYVKRIGEVVLDGSEGWLFNTSYLYAELTLNDYSGLAENICINNRLPQISIYGNESSLNNNRHGLMIGKNKLIRIRMADEQSGQTLDGVKQYLSQNPITVYYELAEPITTTVDPIGVPFAYENGHVILESGYNGQSLLPTLEYSTVVNRTGQVESVAKTIMKQEEQLSSLEKMLVQSIVEMDYNNTLLTLNLEIDEVM